MEEILKILVVDDDAIERMAVCQCLKATPERVEVWEASDCAGAIAILQREQFHCIFLNYSLPEGEGLALLEQLHAAGVGVPIAVLIDREDENLAVKLKQAGASDCIWKAKLSNAINRSLANLIGIYQAQKELAIKQEQLNCCLERYRLLMEVSKDAIWEWDIEKDEICWNHRLGEIIGTSDSFASAGSQTQSPVATWEEFAELLHPEDKQKVSAAIAAHLKDNVEFNLEIRLRHISGEYRYCLTWGRAQRDEKGNPVRMIGIIRDIPAAKKGWEYPHSQAFAALDKRLEEDSYPLEQEFITAIEDNVGEKLRRAMATLNLQQQQLRTLQELTNLLNQRLTNLPNLLQVMVQSVCDAIPKAQFCLIVLHNPQCNRLVLTVTAGIGTEKLRLEDAFGDGRGWLAKVASVGFSHFVQGRSNLPASVYAVPIESAQAGRLGVLAIGNWDDTGAFDREDRNLLMAVGEQAAIAINNARIIKMLEEREERLALQNKIFAKQNQELETQREQIHLQNLQLLEAARLKSQFLATVSHELRTPMNAVIGFSQLLLRQLKNDSGSHESRTLTPEQVNMLERILNNGKHLLELINDLLDLSKIEVGGMKLEREQVNLATLVRDTTEELRSLAEEKHLDLQVITHLSDPIIVNDSTRLRQVLVNLLSNAIKFTYVGWVRVEALELDSTRLVIRVRDTGIGIAEENLEHIFEQFWQADQSTTKVHYGTGLGLAIIKSLVELMKGTVRVKSKLGEGSIFEVEIPRELPPCSYQSQKKPARKLLR